ncbi:MAG: LPS export ABC transporter permease LptF [Gammaproteobacteria bacterium]
MILRRYIQTEILAKLGWILGLLLLILAGSRFVDYLADTAAGQLPGDLVWRLLAMKMLTTLPSLIPVAVFIAVLLGLLRLARDREITVLYNAGLARRFQVLSVLYFSLALACVVFPVSFYLTPWAEQNVAQLRQQARVEADFSGIKAGTFREFSQGDRMVYVENLSADETFMENIFLQVRQDDALGVLNSGSAGYTFAEESGSRYILFRDGRRYIGFPGQLDYQITEYRAYAVLIEEADGTTVYRKPDAIPSAELLRSDNPGYVAELQWRISTVLSVLLLPLLAVALIRYAASEQRYLPVFVCVTIYFIYSNLLGISKTLLKRDEIPAFVGLWWVHLLLIMLSAGLFYLPTIKTRLLNRRPAR